MSDRAPRAADATDCSPSAPNEGAATREARILTFYSVGQRLATSRGRRGAGGTKPRGQRPPGLDCPCCTDTLTRGAPNALGPGRVNFSLPR